MRITDFPMLMEVKDAYICLRKEGKCRDDATRILVENYSDELDMGADDDAFLFWVGLADGQYARKELSTEVAQQALSALSGIEQTDWDVTRGDIQRRRNRYAEAPMPERKVGKPKKKFRCTWSIGDTFAYLFSGADAVEAGLSGKYALLRKVADVEYEDGSILPALSISIWPSLPFPEDNTGFQSVPILKINADRMGIPYGMYEYRALLMIRNKKQLDSIPLRYVGNFDMRMPTDEAVYDYAGYMTMLLPERFEKNLCIYWKMHNYYSARATQH